MPTTYEIADDDVLTLCARVRKAYHPRLEEAGVEIGVLFARNAEGPPVKSGGYPVLAKIKAVPLKDRVSKDYDAELVIDAGEYEKLKEEQRAAMLDHELSHITTIDLEKTELDQARVHDPEAKGWKLDDLGRPRLKTVLGDWNAGDGFGLVVARHGLMAIEYENLRIAKGRADAADKEGQAGVMKAAARKLVESTPLNGSMGDHGHLRHKTGGKRKKKS